MASPFEQPVGFQMEPLLRTKARNRHCTMRSSFRGTQVSFTFTMQPMKVA